MGIHSIGYVMICFGVVNAICSIIFGSIMQYIGRIPIIALGKLNNLFCLFLLEYHVKIVCQQVPLFMAQL